MKKIALKEIKWLMYFRKQNLKAQLTGFKVFDLNPLG